MELFHHAEQQLSNINYQLILIFASKQEH